MASNRREGGESYAMNLGVMWTLQTLKNVDFRCQSLERGLMAHGVGVFLQMAVPALCFA